MTNHPTQLERVYLLNVLIYIPTIESIKKFIWSTRNVKKFQQWFEYTHQNIEQMNNIKLISATKSFHKISSQFIQQLKRLNAKPRNFKRIICSTYLRKWNWSNWKWISSLRFERSKMFHWQSERKLSIVMHDLSTMKN